MGERFIKKLNYFLAGSMYSIDMAGNRTSHVRDSKELGYFVSQFLKQRDQQLKEKPDYGKKS